MLSRTSLWSATMLLWVVVGAAVPPHAGGTTAVSPLAIEELSHQSDLVVHGTVESLTPFRGGDRVFTRVEIRVAEALKGTTLSERVVLKLYGGLMDGRRTFVVGAPCLRANEEVVVFLKPNGPSTFNVVSLAEGKFEVVRTGGVPTVRRALGGISYHDARALQGIPKSLDRLKEAVRATR